MSLVDWCVGNGMGLSKIDDATSIYIRELSILVCNS